ncbi:MAG: heavy-metal-associated domain-containing protein [Micromonosporaceae bacterium]
MGQATTLTFRVEGMHCASCGMLIDDTLEDLDGVRRAQTSVKAGRTTVDLDPAACEPTDVIAAIAEAGYHAHPE